VTASLARDPLMRARITRISQHHWIRRQYWGGGP
jgi:hypothetical protein